MGNGIYEFEPDDYQSVVNSHFDDLPRMSHRDGFDHMQTALLDLLEGRQSGKFAKRGYVLIVNGAWGAGKTTATWALVNSIREAVVAKDPAREPLVLDRSFLPFGGVSESITLFLKELAHELWVKGMVDVRKYMEQFILEATPSTNGSEYTGTLSIGPISITRPIKIMPKDITHDVMVERFRKLAPKNKTAILIIDDLDRLRPEEIVQVMRMVEKLRTFPRVLVILPVYKQIITEAFRSDLQISASAAPTFLRKLTDLEVKIDNNLPDISQAFCELFTQEVKQDFESALRPYGLPIDALCWFMLMHNIIVAEAVTKASDLDSPAKLFNGVESRYLRELQQLFSAHYRITTARYENVPSFPCHYRNEKGEELFVPLGRYYGEIANNPGNELSIWELSETRNMNNVMKLITKDSSLENTLHASGQSKFEKVIEETASAPVMTEVLIPRLRELSDEPLITDYYKLRDARILARKILGHPYFKNEPNSLIGNLYFAVKDSFDSFRF